MVTRPIRNQVSRGCGAAALLVAIVVVAFLGVVRLGPFVILDLGHYRFVRHLVLGTMEPAVVAAVGQPLRIYTFDEREELFDQFGHGLPGKAPTGWSGYYHTWDGRGREFPVRFHHAAAYHHDSWGEFLFYDDRGKLFCVLSGRT